MTDVCLYVQVHQPYRLRRYRVFDIGTGAPYWDDATNRGVLRRVADRCYLPTNGILAEQIRRTGGAFRVAMSCSGVLLEQLEAGAPDVIDSFRELVATGGVEILGETYYHSIASLSDLAEFAAQVQAHTALVQRLFGVTPRTFRNTELLYHDGLAGPIADMGFRGVLLEGADHILHGRTPNAVYAAVGDSGVRLIPRNYRLSDDVAFRFSQRSWNEWPLTADRYASWLAGVGAGSAHVFIDYETFGEHQWAETGIFDFIRHLPSECLRRGIRFVHPSELAARDPTETLGVPWATSWADTERDASAWLGNRMQQAAFNRLNRLYGPVCETNDASYLDCWRRLSTSDHLYYMSTKRLADAEVHSYFNPYANPYDAFVAYMNVLQDLEQRVDAVGAAAAAGARVVDLAAAERGLTQPAMSEPKSTETAAIGEQPVTRPRKAKTPHAEGGGAEGGDAKGRGANARSATRRPAKGPSEAAQRSIRGPASNRKAKTRPAARAESDGGR